LNIKISKAVMKVGNVVIPFSRVAAPQTLKANTFYVDKPVSLLCFDLGKGINEVMI
jgi:hypothetical protein